MEDTRGNAPRSRPRLPAVDAARGLALIGMVIVNVGPVPAVSLLHRLYLLPYGRASVLFVVVAGMAMTLLLRRSGDRTVPVVVYRAAVLLLGGLALGALGHGVNVILPVYGLLFLLALGARFLPSWSLLVAAGFFSLAGPVLYIASFAQQGGATPTEVAPDESGGDLLQALLATGPYPLAVWIAPFLVGMVVARLDLHDRAVQRRLAIGGATAAVGAFLLSRIAPALAGDAVERGYLLLLTGTAHGQMPLWILSGVGGALAVVGALLLAWDAVGRMLRPLVAAGRLALTLYVAHLLLLALIRPADGFTVLEGVVVGVGTSTALVVVAVLYSRLGRAGPLEWLLRGDWLLPQRGDDRHDDRRLAPTAGRAAPEAERALV